MFFRDKQYQLNALQKTYRENRRYIKSNDNSIVQVVLIDGKSILSTLLLKAPRTLDLFFFSLLTYLFYKTNLVTPTTNSLQSG